ncbi:VOC family protein [Paenibacillus sediminis]|uniref:Catechol 2,3-dioxygenase-like lactoylglutathione lyase family enzyme n=1 Tax=Paenibacillus sediminis TaxID=664909 RepID=A0ABS4H535_9BACL|nr:VOC family protein [Paenibacillus sediminis]MBP1937195.1 catechol 2,3-dioxygenase-like lactoylglutathione lyase family enzyme [Paenibacillus sediminis]
MEHLWSEKMPAVQFRVARPTHQMDKIIDFYGQGLGLEIIGSFANHNGYDGVMFGLPNAHYHLEFTQHEDASAVPPPSEDNLLVFYIPDRKRRDEIASRLHQMGYPSVEPENPYWAINGITICDPDGWRIVLQNSSGLSLT